MAKEHGGGKERLDVLLVERGLCPTREKAKALIMAGAVLVDDHTETKPGTRFSREAPLRIRDTGAGRYVSRGGEKLDAALKEFHVDPNGLSVLDAGASTGGFTDCLLQHGAAHVTALDVGYGQLAMKLRNDPRVTVMERVNARHVRPEDFSHKFDLITIDVSFISLAKVMPALAALLSARGRVLALVKPQFEAGPEHVGRGGVVRKTTTHCDVMEAAVRAARDAGLCPAAAIHSPIKGPAGNIEFLMLMVRDTAPGLAGEDISKIVIRAHELLA